MEYLPPKSQFGSGRAHDEGHQNRFPEKLSKKARYENRIEE